MRQRGLSDQQIGIIGALRPWFGTPASFVWAMLADLLKVCTLGDEGGRLGRCMTH